MSDTVTISKDSTFEEKVAFLREQMHTPETEDAIAIRNIFCLVSNQLITDELFADPSVIFVDIEEFSDIKTELSEDIREVKKAIATAYLSIIVSCRPVTVIHDGKLKNVPNLYEVLLGNLEFFNLNILLNKYLFEIKEEDMYIVPNAIQLAGVLMSPVAVLNKVVTTVFGDK